LREIAKQAQTKRRDHPSVADWTRRKPARPSSFRQQNCFRRPKKELPLALGLLFPEVRGDAWGGRCGAEARGRKNQFQKHLCLRAHHRWSRAFPTRDTSRWLGPLSHAGRVPTWLRLAKRKKKKKQRAPGSTRRADCNIMARGDICQFAWRNKKDGGFVAVGGRGRGPHAPEGARKPTHTPKSMEQRPVSSWQIRSGRRSRDVTGGQAIPPAARRSSCKKTQARSDQLPALRSTSDWAGHHSSCGADGLGSPIRTRGLGAPPTRPRQMKHRSSRYSAKKFRFRGAVGDFENSFVMGKARSNPNIPAMGTTLLGMKKRRPIQRSRARARPALGWFAFFSNTPECCSASKTSHTYLADSLQLHATGSGAHDSPHDGLATCAEHHSGNQKPKNKWTAITSRLFKKKKFIAAVMPAWVLRRNWRSGKPGRGVETFFEFTRRCLDPQRKKPKSAGGPGAGFCCPAHHRPSTAAHKEPNATLLATHRGEGNFRYSCRNDVAGRLPSAHPATAMALFLARLAWGPHGEKFANGYLGVKHLFFRRIHRRPLPLERAVQGSGF